MDRDDYPMGGPEEEIEVPNEPQPPAPAEDPPIELDNMKLVFVGRTWQFDDSMDQPFSFLPHGSVELPPGTEVTMFVRGEHG